MPKDGSHRSHSPMPAFVVAFVTVVVVLIAATGAPPVAADPPPVRSGSVFDYDAGVPLDPRVSRRRTTRLARVESLTYNGANGAGDRVPAILSLPRRGKRPFPCLIEGHGLGGGKHETVEVADDYAEPGVGVFAIDARFHGARGGERRAEQAVANIDELYALFRLTVIDLRRGLDYLQTRPECDPDRIGYVGYSLGGLMGAMLAGADPRVRAPALVMAGGDWRLLLGMSEVYPLPDKDEPQTFDSYLARMAPLDPLYWVGRISPRPVLIVHGDRDRVVPTKASQALYGAARSPKRRLIYRGGHEIPKSQEDRVFGALYRWMVSNLRPANG